MERRKFVTACAAGAALAAARQAGALPSRDAIPRLHGRAQLVDDLGKPIRVADLAVGRNYIFHYPYAGTPCFLLRLDKPAAPGAELKTRDGKPYRWPGGVGPDRTVVAYSAICAHQMAYPTRQISFISYRSKAPGAPGAKLAASIHCCAEHSEYDPAHGARVVAGPAHQPLAAILLEHDAASDSLHATGTLGGELFDAFFEKYAMKLSLDWGGRDPKQAVNLKTTVTELENFCRQQVSC